MTTLPAWPPHVTAVLTTVTAAGPQAIPVFTPVRAGDHTILLSLHRSLTWLRDRPEVALLVVGEGGVAFTARGLVRVVAESMPGAPEHAAFEITVTGVDHHRDEQRGLNDRVTTLHQLAAIRRRCEVAARSSP